MFPGTWPLIKNEIRAHKVQKFYLQQNERTGHKMLQGSSIPYECNYSKTLVVWALFVGLKRGKSLFTMMWLGWVSFLTERLALGEDLFTVHVTCLWF